MSKDLQPPQQSEEVDLGQLFKLIGKTFDKLFKFIGGIFNKLFLAFVWLVFFVKKNIIKLAISGVLGIGYGVLKDKTSDPVYKSYITVKQNYATGENLYNTISYYNDLVQQDDIETLQSILEVDQTQASSILEFKIESVISDNEKIKNFSKYRKELDTTLASTIDYETYLNNSQDYSHEFQQITIKSKERKNFKVVFEKFAEQINTNPFFKREQEKDLNELKYEEQMLKDALTKSDSLQSTYKRVLERVVDNNGGREIGITFEGNNSKNLTREFDLYKNDLEIRDRLVENIREQADKEYILEIVSSKQDSGSIDYKKELFGLSINPKLFYAIVFSILIFVVLIGLRLIKGIERFNKHV